tara:strand:- start:1544 stop:2389 length:846 start_codon:yes stop_codon:yes gene_type:complete
MGQKRIKEEMKITKRQLKQIIEEELQISLLSEGLRYHIDTSTPLTKNIYRVGSEAYFKIIAEARIAYKKGVYNPINEEEKEILKSELGQWAIFEGERVPLDFPMYEESIKEGTIESARELIGREPDDASAWQAIGLRDFCDDTDHEDIVPPEFLSDYWIGYENGEYEGCPSPDGMPNQPDMMEAKRKKKSKKKDPPIGKPMKGSGGKKYQVYVRNKKTGRVKKISYGDSKGGLKGNWNSAEARSNFASRHNCAEKKDRTKAGYWACRAHKDFGTDVPGRFW